MSKQNYRYMKYVLTTGEVCFGKISVSYDTNANWVQCMSCSCSTSGRHAWLEVTYYYMSGVASGQRRLYCE